ncbi:hypothetical protein AMS68_004739 [Peltaster fructicola]|uniref:Uncharacterized protein n=1 Tax=Peltaster fructicola TaxID=286661 RepID=A0A6H0XWS0_9PEZI|nr:hypothetical protein AMS68_004739 [Peltaster fructicola]
MASFFSKVTTKVSNKLGIDTGPEPTATKQRADSLVTALGTEALFTKTRPEVDGPECEHDCESCTIRLPRKWSIDEEDKLYGFVKGWSRHLLVATGKTDWVRDVEEEQGSVMEAVGKHGNDVTGEGPYGPDRPTTVLLLPVFKWCDNVTPNHVPELISSVINNAPTNTNQPSTSRTDAALPAGLSLRNCGHTAIILLCSQATRDARCGQSAPLLRKELERHLRPLGLYRDLHDERPGGVGIYFISHVGGHKYSANMMVYRKGDSSASSKGEASQCIWLARIRPEDCENIVRYTVLQGKVVKPERQLRGGFDRDRGIVSW